ncbi:MAG: hypothetical protein ACXVB5_19085 [Isosphaeraceae bacterium]
MPVIGAIRQRMLLLARSEQGIALPTALMAMVASFALASVAILSSVDAQQGTGRDIHAKNAIAAADAGANIALERLNRYHKSLTPATPCVGPSGEHLSPSGGWCPATEAETVGGSTFSYQVSAFEEEVPLSVVAIGTANGVSRRIEVGLMSYAGEEVFANEKLIGQNGVEVVGSAIVRTDIGTNGDITREGNAATICGNLRHGIGHTAPKPDCEDEVTEGNKNLPPVEVPEDLATNNDNCRLEATCADKTIVDTYSKKRSSSAPYEASTRTVQINGGATLTMGGSRYFICKLEIQSGELIMAAGPGVESHIYFDTPENCGLSAGSPQVVITGNGKVFSTGYNPAEGKFNLPVLYLIGSPSIETKVELEGTSSTLEMIIYAPNSKIDIGGNSKLLGMAAGKSLFIHGNATIESDPGVKPPDILYESLWERTHYVECTGTEVSPPNAYC